jgi:2,4-dienoyl-CoA reductase-like NADH-dependent reductase (Old Yellow Enzyme family)
MRTAVFSDTNTRSLGRVRFSFSPINCEQPVTSTANMDAERVRHVRCSSSRPVISSACLRSHISPEQAEAIVTDGHGDCVALGRGFLDDPRWAWHAAAALGADAVYAPQYLRARPAHWPGAALTRHRAAPERS